MKRKFLVELNEMSASSDIGTIWLYKPLWRSPVRQRTMKGL